MGVYLNRGFESLPLRLSPQVDAAHAPPYDRRVPIAFLSVVLADHPGIDHALLADELWTRSKGTCALCTERMDRDDDALTAARGADGASYLAHARCEHDVIGPRDRERLEDEGAAAVRRRRGWRLRRRVRPAASSLPLLKAGATRRWEWCVGGALDEGSAFTCGCLRIHYSEEDAVDEDGGVAAGDDDHWTVALVGADLPDVGFVVLRERDRFAEALGAGAPTYDRRRVPFESAAFEDQIAVIVPNETADETVRSWFTPVVLDALAARGFDDEAGLRWEAAGDGVLAARHVASEPSDLPELIDLLGDALWLRAVLDGALPGRLPDRSALRAIALG